MTCPHAHPEQAQNISTNAAQGRRLHPCPCCRRLFTSEARMGSHFGELIAVHPNPERCPRCQDDHHRDGVAKRITETSQSRHTPGCGTARTRWRFWVS